MAKYALIVQPGLAREAAGEPILRLLGSTELFLKKTAEAKFLVLCGELPSAGERRGRRKGLETGGEVQPDKRPPGMKSTSF